MAEATTEFFEGLEQRGFDPLLEKATGRIGFELVNGKKSSRWLVAIDKGKVDVSHKSGTTDCTVRTTGELFDEVVRGETNALAAVLRGAITIEGDPELLMLFQRVFSGPPKAAPSRRRSSAGGRRAS
jgi:predicted lipid carrier protein YhbT